MPATNSTIMNFLKDVKGGYL